MHHWAKRIFVAAAPLLLTGCLWGPGKFASDLTLKKDGSFVLDYRGEIVLQTPPDMAEAQAWKDEMARCFVGIDGRSVPQGVIAEPGEPPKERPCTRAEIAAQKAEHAEKAVAKRKENEQMAKIFGLPGLDDESNRAFAAKLSKYAGYRSVQYRGKGVFDVDYHLEGRATQDFVFPTLPDNDFLIPFVAIRRRADGSVLVTAPAFTGGAGPFGARAGSAAARGMKDGPVSKAQGRFTIVTDGEILTNNSEDGPAAHPAGRQVHWDVTATSQKIPEALIRLR
jgi:hypothetical protein